MVLVPVVNPADATYKYKYQGQERQDELGLNWDSFKWRNYDYAIGRFFDIDPLTEKYHTWSPYVFSGNRVIDARELEGLEPYVLYGSQEEAFNNFGNQYNGLSIMTGNEIATIFYSIGDKFSYIRPKMGSSAWVLRNEEDVALVPEGANPIAGGHTHGAAVKNDVIFKPSTSKYENSSSNFSGPDIELSENLNLDNPNEFNKPMTEVMYAPDGGQRIYDPAKQDSKKFWICK